MSGFFFSDFYLFFCTFQIQWGNNILIIKELLGIEMYQRETEKKKKKIEIAYFLKEGFWYDRLHKHKKNEIVIV